MDFFALAESCAPGVAAQTLAAVVRTESGFRPLAIGINGGARLQRQAVTKEEAVVTATWLIANGYNIDMGLGQINSANLTRLGLRVEDVFDPCKNLAASATLLQSNYRAAVKVSAGEQAALHAALSAYNTGSFSRGFTNGYVGRVVRNADFARGVPIPVVGSQVGTRRSDAVLRAQAPSKAVGTEEQMDFGGNGQESVLVYR